MDLPDSKTRQEMRKCQHEWEVLPIDASQRVRERLSGASSVSLLRCLKCNYRTTITKDTALDLLSDQDPDRSDTTVSRFLLRQNRTGADEKDSDELIVIKILLEEAAIADSQGKNMLAEALYKHALRKAEIEPLHFSSEVVSEFASYLERTGRATDALNLRARIKSPN